MWDGFPHSGHTGGATSACARGRPRTWRRREHFRYPCRSHGPTDHVPAGPWPPDRRRSHRLRERLDPLRPRPARRARRAPAFRGSRGAVVLELLDLRNRRERLEPRHLEVDPGVAATVRGLIDDVRTRGDEALKELTLKFDGADLREVGLVATPEEFLAAREAAPASLRRALDALVQRLAAFHARQLPQQWEVQEDGVRAWEIVRPLRAAAC